jgi:hypothetical protein
MTSTARGLVKDQRASRRYAVRADLRYLIVSRRTRIAGTGRTVDLSSRGALIQTADPLPKGAKIKLSIAWPARLNGRIALSLELDSRIARVDGLLVGVVFDRHEFRTRGLRYEAAQEAPEARGGAVAAS